MSFVVHSDNDVDILNSVALIDQKVTGNRGDIAKLKSFLHYRLAVVDDTSFRQGLIDQLEQK